MDLRDNSIGQGSKGNGGIKDDLQVSAMVIGSPGPRDN